MQKSRILAASVVVVGLLILVGVIAGCKQASGSAGLQPALARHKKRKSTRLRMNLLLLPGYAGIPFRSHAPLRCSANHLP